MLLSASRRRETRAMPVLGAIPDCGKRVRESFPLAASVPLPIIRRGRDPRRLPIPAQARPI